MMKYDDNIVAYEGKKKNATLLPFVQLQTRYLALHHSGYFRYMNNVEDITYWAYKKLNF